MSLVDIPGREGLDSPNNGRMVRENTRTIRHVPPAFVMLLAATGALPQLAQSTKQLGWRPAGLNEVALFTWVLEYDGEFFAGDRCAQPAGVIAYRDTYDFHSGSDVREVAYINGSRRAIVNLFKHVRDEARFIGRRLVGLVPRENIDEIKLLKLLGGVETDRVVIEDGG